MCKADGPADNQAQSVRPMPPPGIAISDDDRGQLGAGLKELNEQIADLRAKKDSLIQEYLPDVEIFARAVSLALAEDGFYEPKDVERAKELLKVGSSRAVALSGRATPWTHQYALNNVFATVRGYRSKLDGTVQPYGVVFGVGGKSQRADVWCRGRSEKGLELQFISARMNSTDPTPEPGVMMIHPFGRYCNANKLAGEVDTLEATDHAIKSYDIDPSRVSIRGFSMGGAAAWHLAVHYPDRWFAANPGAGFSETPEFLKVFQSEDLKPAWYEEKLWQLYDCPVWVRNLRMVPTIAYSGEIDKQKQAADIMAAASWNLPENERFELTHIIAPKTAHQVAPVARKEIERRLAILDGLRKQDPPSSLAFTTTTLKYNGAHWLTINALQEHWKPANVVARITNVANGQAGRLEINSTNVTDLSVEWDAGKFNTVYVVSVGEQSNQDKRKLFHLRRRSDLTAGIRLRLMGDTWEQVSPIEPASKELVKKHDLQGPIDDAFMGPFIFVKPTADGRNPEVDKWVKSEFERAVREWHRQMRGDAVVKTSEELTPGDIENNHLVLWGDPQSNPTLAKILDKLPIQWGDEKIAVGDKRYDNKTHVPVMVYPNPLNQDKYVVLNSSFTYREYDYLNNARQVPKLPDWAIIDITTAPNARWPGKVVDANFFGEKWELK